METLKEAFNEKYPAYSKRILEKFEKVNKCEANWENITKPNLAKFVNSLQKDVARSSARTYCAMFKAVLNLYSDVVEFPRGFGDILTVKSDVSENVYLTEEEVQKIIDYEPENDTERAVRNQFILGYLTCARMSDYVTFTRENIFNDKLRYVSKKHASRQSCHYLLSSKGLSRKMSFTVLLDWSILTHGLIKQFRKYVEK